MFKLGIVKPLIKFILKKFKKLGSILLRKQRRNKNIILTGKYSYGMENINSRKLT